MSFSHSKRLLRQQVNEMVVKNFIVKGILFSLVVAFVISGVLSDEADEGKLWSCLSTIWKTMRTF